MQQPTRLIINVVSDTICPWCFVGKRRLEKALLAVGGAVQAEVRWRPFFTRSHVPQSRHVGSAEESDLSYL